MRKLILLIQLLIFSNMVQSQILDLSAENKTPTYVEVIEYYKSLDSASEFAKLVEYGMTDSGKPLHLFIIDSDKEFDPAASRKKGKSILLINNGIHPGEPDGIDACLQLTTSLLRSKNINEQLKNLTICIIPVYNIDGALNRNSTSRVNQDGPEEFGFRGNGQNYDLNRDFIKCDALNAQSFTKIFREWDPDVFVDTHVSNGADYQYVMTLIATQHSKLTPPLGDFLKNAMLPALYTEMEKAGFPMCPYVNPIDNIPDNGIAAFLETGRYSTGYAALFNTIGFMPETHMLKPYPQRVASTLALLQIYIKYVNDHSAEIIRAREQAKKITKESKEFIINRELDMNKREDFLFKGYEARFKPSEVSGLERLWYDRNAPFEKNIAFYDHYIPTQKITAPQAYIIPKAWREVIDRLKWNNIEMEQLAKDTIMEVEVYYIEDFETTPNAFEGHYLHSNVALRTEKQKIQYYKGDYIIHVNQETNNYIINTLEPQAPDSYFAWGFFDAILMQKEWFSDYVFEDIAAELLKQEPDLKTKLEEKKISDPEFAKDAFAQLQFVYSNSKYHEKSFMRYPVGRIL
ncbi:MAG: M14 family zinc carboxypeptidase [Chitinophagales bacterium]